MASGHGDRLLRCDPGVAVVRRGAPTTAVARSGWGCRRRGAGPQVRDLVRHLARQRSLRVAQTLRAVGPAQQSVATTAVEASRAHAAQQVTRLG